MEWYYVDLKFCIDCIFYVLMLITEQKTWSHRKGALKVVSAISTAPRNMTYHGRILTSYRGNIEIITIRYHCFTDHDRLSEVPQPFPKKHIKYSYKFCIFYTFTALPSFRLSSKESSLLKMQGWHFKTKFKQFGSPIMEVGLWILSWPR